MRVCVQGLWHLGSVIAASLASIGHSVVGYDESNSVVLDLLQAKAPISEGGLNDLVAMGLVDGTLSFSRSKSEAMADVEILWIAYDTSVDDNDVADVDYVISQTIDSLSYLPIGATILISSQLPVGSIMRL
jgi:UDPglucose 6-dehydrogenase